MDYSAVLQEVDTWPVEQRLQLMDAMWESLDHSGTAPTLTEAQMAELDRRIAASEATPDDVVDWDDVQEFVRRPR